MKFKYAFIVFASTIASSAFANQTLWQALFSDDFQTARDIVNSRNPNDEPIDPNYEHPNIPGMTVLWLAAEAGEGAMVEALMRRFPEANANAAPLRGPHQDQTAFWYTTYFERWDTARLMRDRDPSIDPNRGPNAVQTPVTFALRDRQFDMYRRLTGGRFTDRHLEALRATRLAAMHVAQLHAGIHHTYPTHRRQPTPVPRDAAPVAPQSSYFRKSA